MYKLRIASVALAASLFAGAAGALAQDATPVATEEEATTEEETTTQGGDIDQIAGAAGLVAAVVQVADTIDINNTDVEVVTVEVEDSLNDLQILNDVLNNSPILNENNVVITDVIEVGDIDPIIAIGILDSGDLIIFTRDDR